LLAWYTESNRLPPPKYVCKPIWRENRTSAIKASKSVKKKYVQLNAQSVIERKNFKLKQQSSRTSLCNVGPSQVRSLFLGILVISNNGSLEPNMEDNDSLFDEESLQRFEIQIGAFSNPIIPHWHFCLLHITNYIKSTTIVSTLAIQWGKKKSITKRTARTKYQ